MSKSIVENAINEILNMTYGNMDEKTQKIKDIKEKYKKQEHENKMYFAKIHVRNALENAAEISLPLMGRMLVTKEDILNCYKINNSTSNT